MVPKARLVGRSREVRPAWIWNVTRKGDRAAQPQLMVTVRDFPQRFGRRGLEDASGK